ncbi:MAG: hypothetical protein LRZ85_02670 [Alphaproteobacteria bacterium]|nr:hypothetical protein [Alphaproteobacteria bacterium]MCD8519759.1 hypothetical protein [Alphaproteobacteria bacterium]
MKKTLLLTALLTAASMPALAQQHMTYQEYMQQKQAQEASGATADTEDQMIDPVMAAVKPLQDEWARIKYQIPDKDKQLEAIHVLETRAEQVTKANPSRAEPMIWEAIILSTDAGIVKGLSALSKVEKAKNLLEGSLRVNPKALDGSAHTSLGSLYYQVPGWPVAFGDDEEAEKHLKLALQMNPDGIDPNFFYGDFLIEDDREAEARPYLERALMAPDRPGRELADAGRRQEIKAKLAELN